MTRDDMLAVQDLQAFVRARATQDPQFRQALLADPREAISHALGVELPSTVIVEVREGSSDHVMLRLPPNSESLDHPWFTQSEPGIVEADCCCCC